MIDVKALEAAGMYVYSIQNEKRAFKMSRNTEINLRSLFILSLFLFVTVLSGFEPWLLKAHHQALWMFIGVVLVGLWIFLDLPPFRHRRHR